MELVVVAVDGDTSMIGDGPGHGCHAGDDARGRVVALDGVRGLACLTPPAQDEDLSITHGHATALLHRQTQMEKEGETN